ncbi:MAG: acetyl-CoA carboxylase biotin carboxylase subunit [Candidatus Aminicenantes bacterium]|nr:acetyl-CoA carboxylase biotin carboxylase subunit [Candidatus Aminicenantes bacterium]
MFKKILIANRGEIAVRIIRACREMDIIPVAVFSEVDRRALHVRLAEEAYFLGPSEPAASYLNIEKIIAVAKECGAEAIHPGYGFLAENHEFVREVERAGLIFIGPPSEPMEIMGKKTKARQRMAEAGVPCIPGTWRPLTSEEELVEEAQKIGFPLLLKADAGGGGKGLRLVKEEKELRPAFRLACSESKSSFGDPAVYLEKYIINPHHIEIQILADQQGNVIYLGERECSIQRRFQKVLEETPSPFLDPVTRVKMGQAAVQAAQAVGYTNAGTVEFIVDEDKNFYFLEMNTRLQVEHPVTEMVTGIDLVKAQIRIAAGEPLPWCQEDIRPIGHSIQCRIYAEDPDQDFMPSPGKITHLHPVSGGPGVREDIGVYEGFEVPVEYDPLLSKVITWGLTREEAMARMKRVFDEYQICGIKTTIPFFRRILSHPEFVAGRYNTHFIQQHEASLFTPPTSEPEEIALIAAGIASYTEGKKIKISSSAAYQSRWKFYGKLTQFSKRL